MGNVISLSCVAVEFSLDNKMSEYEMHLADKASDVMENLSVNYIAVYFMLHISLVALFQYSFVDC